MKILKILSISLVVIYIGLVILFESWLGYSQPSNANSLVITTFDDQEAKDRVLSAVNNNEKLYVSANHWPRAWYQKVLANPDVQVMIDGKTRDYTAVEVTASNEAVRVDSARPRSVVVLLLTGFPPRRFVRLDG